jgi:hypothetical protein
MARASPSDGVDEDGGVGAFERGFAHMGNRLADGVVEGLYFAVDAHGTGGVGQPDEMKRARGHPAAGSARRRVVHGVIIARNIEDTHRTPSLTE